MKAYFQEVFWRKGPEQFDIGSGSTLFNYQTAAKDYRMIESGLSPVIINDNDKVHEVLDRLNSDAASPGKAARDLQNFVVQVPPKDVEVMRKNGRVAYHRQDLWGDRLFRVQVWYSKSKAQSMAVRSGAVAIAVMILLEPKGSSKIICPSV